MIGFVPTLELVIEDQVQFQMHMGAFAIDPGAGVTHYRNVLPALRHVTGADVDLTQVPIQAVIRRAVPNMFDDDVLAGASSASEKDSPALLLQIPPEKL